ncbi:phosphatidylethanolamine-binding protein 4 [Hippocampus comes]|uniref:Phosphatidylethanolamine binding protein 4 n=1 Tax=Hippocampus comes TaxID=109280 RepID=A0A3Q2ZJU2_HIPCM|nr:PREDICTED: phosphatidylethanolamine-binding protein 4 [Hippocampus comes]
MLRNDFGAMSLLPVFLLSCGCMSGSHLTEASDDTLSPEDASFCDGELEVQYPELLVNRCLIVPEEFREKLSTIWGAPLIRYRHAQEVSNYTLIMVDPDAPSRSKPVLAYWRHWVITDMEWSSLKNGVLTGTIIDDYQPPTPPRGTGFHRYQFLLFHQGSNITSDSLDSESRGKWNLDAFVLMFHLGEPVAKLQFLTQNYED